MESKAYLFLFLFILGKYNILYSQNYYGLSGLLRVPVAELPLDGTLSFGSNIIDENINSFGHFKTKGYLTFVSLTYLPFLEINLSITRLFNPYIRKEYGENQAIGDRSLNLKVKITNEDKFIFNSSAGLYNVIAAFGGEKAIHNHSGFFVIDKNIVLNDFVRIKVLLGYGFNIFKNASSTILHGPFYGTNLKLFNVVSLMTEYDGKHSNSGLRIKLFDHLSILGGLLQHKHFSGGVSVSFQL
jgi:hypothetical protein